MTATKDMRVLVVGATGALGGEIARELAARGSRVAVSGRSAERTASLAADLGVPAIPADLRSPGAPEWVVREAASHLGGLDAVVQCAGVVAYGPVHDLTDETLVELVETNLLAPARLARAALGELGRGGTIVQVSAIVADMPVAGMAAYSASKAGLTAVDRALAREARRDGVRVVDVRPPHLDTGLETRPIAGEPPKLPPGRDVREVAHLIVDALGDERAREVDFG